MALENLKQKLKCFEGSNKVLALSKAMNVLSLPIYPIKVNFNIYTFLNMHLFQE